MKKVLIFATMIVVFAACSNNNQSNSKLASQTTAISPEGVINAPKFEFEESSYNFGKIAAGEKVTHEFKFKNSGKTPLIISDAQATCGCTIPDFPDKPIVPGANGVIKVIFNSTGKSGKQDKVITLTANTNPVTTKLHLIGEVEVKK